MTTVAKRRQRPEEALQRSCVEFMELCVPPPPDGPAWTAINPVPAKSKAVAGISKAMGLRAGIMDLWMLQRGRTIMVEFKSKDGSLSKAQRERRQEVEDAGGTVYAVRTVDQFIEVLKAEGVPLRAVLW